MNSLETEYSFLAPTWKLPSIGTSSLYTSTYDVPYLSPTAKSGPDMVSKTKVKWNHTNKKKFVIFLFHTYKKKHFDFIFFLTLFGKILCNV